MWVFGYGSLMWTGWEVSLGCGRRCKAVLLGYRRAFIKASIKNWGSAERPCPTLDIVPSPSAQCEGIAFEFPDDKGALILSYLAQREGKDFSLCELAIEREGVRVQAVVPIYHGYNLISAETPEEIVRLIDHARGDHGYCVDYLRGITESLTSLGIEDPVVTEMWQVFLQRDQLGHGDRPSRS
jgi:cation transport protein ChaC